MGQHADWLKTMVFIITPIFNADGNEKFALTNRQRQHGPINGMGTRQQGQNLNINRDFMKLDTPEGRAFVKLWNDYDPHVGYDLHTSDGSDHGFFLTYETSGDPNTSPGIASLVRGGLLPSVTKAIKTKHGWSYFSTAGRPGRANACGPATSTSTSRATPRPTSASGTESASCRRRIRTRASRTASRRTTGSSRRSSTMR